jgi:enolase-phosphatase E1
VTLPPSDQSPNGTAAEACANDCAATPALLFDIEGTLASMAVVHELLFPYARRQLASFLHDHGHEPAVREALEQVRTDAAESLPQAPPPTGLTAIIEHLEHLMDQDAKTTGLKQLQGLIWEQGFLSGQLQVALFPDCLPRLQAWKQAGRKLFIYSSGSVHAQKLFFRHTEQGDLTPLWSGFFDTTTGNKRQAASYHRIAEQLGFPTEQVTFFSDVAAELDAAQQAGMRTIAVRRPGNAPLPEQMTHPIIDSLEQLSPRTG